MGEGPIGETCINGLESVMCMSCHDPFTLVIKFFCCTSFPAKGFCMDFVIILCPQWEKHVPICANWFGGRKIKVKGFVQNGGKTKQAWLSLTEIPDFDVGIVDRGQVITTANKPVVQPPGNNE